MHVQIHGDIHRLLEDHLDVAAVLGDLHLHVIQFFLGFRLVLCVGGFVHADGDGIHFGGVDGDVAVGDAHFQRRRAVHLQDFFLGCISRNRNGAEIYA